MGILISVAAVSLLFYGFSILERLAVWDKLCENIFGGEEDE